MIFILFPEEFLQHNFALFSCFDLRTQIKDLNLKFWSCCDGIQFGFVNLFYHDRSMHFVEQLMQKFQKGSWKFIFFFELFEGKTGFKNNVVEYWLDICVQVFSEEIGDESCDVFEPRLKLMGLGIDWSLLVLVQHKDHDENSHIESQGGSIGKDTHNFRNNCFVVFHDNSSGNPIEDWQCLIMSKFGYLFYE